MSGTELRKLQGKLGRVRFLRALPYLGCVACIACSAVDDRELTAQSTTALIGGSLSPPERDAVVFIRANHPDGSFADCTGTLLSPHVVVTAKHCVTLLPAGEFVCTGAGALVENGQGAGVFGAKVDGAKIEIYTGTAPVSSAAAHVLTSFTSESSDACHDDVAVLVLDTGIQQETYPMLRAARPVVIGEAVRLVGYGTVNHDALIERHEIPDVRVIDVGKDDGVQDPNATTPARAFVVAGGTACFGDSGGPALSMDTGALTGVYSRITGDCYAVESRNDFILASSFVELFARAFSQAGEQPHLEPAVGSTTGDSSDAAASGATTGGTAGSSTTTGGSSSTGVTTTQSTRHSALRCSLARLGGGTSSIVVSWILLVLIAGFSRRYFGERLSEGD